MTGTLGNRVTVANNCNQESFSIVSCCNLRIKAALTVSLNVLAMLQSKFTMRYPPREHAFIISSFALLLCLASM